MHAIRRFTLGSSCPVKAGTPGSVRHRSGPIGDRRVVVIYRGVCMGTRSRVQYMLQCRSSQSVHTTRSGASLSSGTGTRRWPRASVTPLFCRNCAHFGSMNSALRRQRARQRGRETYVAVASCSPSSVSIDALTLALRPLRLSSFVRTTTNWSAIVGDR